VSLCDKYGIKEGRAHPTLDFFSDFDLAIIEKKYLDVGHIHLYLQDWYKIVQQANEYITKQEPWKKYKDETTKQDALDDLSFLLYVVKNLALLSAPFMINGFAKIQSIFGNELLNKLDSSKNLLNDDFIKAYEAKTFPVDLKPEIIYQKKLP
jgi:methionyl-tRNA synthetase